MAASVPLAGVALLLSLLLLQTAHGGGVAPGLAGGGRTRPSSSSSSLEGYVPMRTVVYRSSSSSAAAWTSEEYEPFELCMECRCCPSGAGAGAGSNSSSCVATSCCYGIDCNIPGKPFGTCAFTPRSCGCGDAGSNCTSAPAPPS